MLGVRKLARKTDSIIREIPFLEFMELNPQREALMTAINMQHGVEEALYNTTNDLTSRLQKDFESRFGGDVAKKYASRFGDAWVMGLNKLVYDKMNKKWNMLDYSVADIQGIGITGIADAFNKNTRAFYKKLTSDSKIPEVRAQAKKVHSAVQALAEARQGSSLTQVAGKVKRLYDITHKDKMSMLEARKATQHLTSMQIVVKNPKKFNDIYQGLGEYGQGFDDYMNLANEHVNPDTTFGENPSFEFNDGKYEGASISKSNFEQLNMNENDIIGKLVTEDGETMYMVARETRDRYVGNQNSHFIVTNISDMESGMLTNSGVTLYPQNVLDSGNYVDKSIVKQIGRNAWVAMKNNIAHDMAYEQWFLLREQGLLKSHREMKADVARNPKMEYKPLSDNNPLVQNIGSKYYYDARYQHYFEGTPGWNVGKTMENTLGETQMAKTMTSVALAMSNYMRDLRGTILLARANSYINSFLSSATILWQNADSKNPAKFMSQATKELHSYKKLVEQFSEIYMKDQKKGLEFWNTTIKKHKLAPAFDGGLINTIRADAYKLNTIPQLQIYNAVKAATGNDIYANAWRNLALAPDTRLGNTLGTVFDYTELIPKIALYLDQLHAGKKTNFAVQKTMMAFPTYHNLPAGLNIVDNYVPFLKFMLSTPRMITYGLNQNPYRTVALFAAAKSLPSASFALSDNPDYKWFEEQGFIKIPGVPVAYPAQSLFPTVSMPFYSPFHDGILDYSAILSMTKSLTSPINNTLPGNYMPTKSE